MPRYPNAFTILDDDGDVANPRWTFATYAAAEKALRSACRRTGFMRPQIVACRAWESAYDAVPGVGDYLPSGTLPAVYGPGMAQHGEVEI